MIQTINTGFGQLGEQGEHYSKRGILRLHIFN